MYRLPSVLCSCACLGWSGVNGSMCSRGGGAGCCVVGKDSLCCAVGLSPCPPFSCLASLFGTWTGLSACSEHPALQGSELAGLVLSVPGAMPVRAGPGQGRREPRGYVPFLGSTGLFSFHDGGGVGLQEGGPCWACPGSRLTGQRPAVSLCGKPALVWEVLFSGRADGGSSDSALYHRRLALLHAEGRFELACGEH